MNFKLFKASIEHKEVIKNLMQFYIYDFSEYIQCDVETDGSFAPYPNLEDYWKENNRFPYIIMKDEKYIGFALVRFVESTEQNYFSMAEFFIMKKYRRERIGKAAAEQIFNLHRGQWQVHQRENNKPARAFWKKVINEYTNGQFKERFENERLIQDFEN